MSAYIDNVLAFKIISILMTPFQDTDAFKLGIIDKDGNNLIKTKNFTTAEQRDSYSYLNRLCFNLKKLINKLPGGESKAKNIISAYYLVKESIDSNSELILESRLQDIYYQVTTRDALRDIHILEDIVANNTSNVAIQDKPIRTSIRKRIKHIQ